MNYHEKVLGDMLNAQSPSGFDAACHAYLEMLIAAPFWSNGSAFGYRIIWKNGLAAIKDNVDNVFNSPGVYIFGAKNIPRYVGVTEKELRKRLTGRYIGNSNADTLIKKQCHLADKYAEQIIGAGVDGFPEELVAKYKKQHHGSLIRLHGAVDFARCGIENVWFAIIPTNIGNEAKLLEGKLIKSVTDFNRIKGYSDLLNVSLCWK